MSEILTPKKVFITGGNGFIARALATRYRALGAEVCGVDFQPDEAWGVIAGDLMDPASWRDTLGGSDLVIHTAALLSNTGPMGAAWRVNVLGTKLVLDAAVEAGAKRFLHLSSLAAYGFDFTEPVHEEMPLRPINHPYVDTKIASEHIVLAAHAGGKIDCTIVRPADVYGPGSKPWVVLAMEMIRKGKFMLPAHGNGIFAPLYIDDLAEGVILAAGHENGKGQIFNICGDEAPTCQEYFSYLARFVGKQKVPSISSSLANTLTDVLGGIARAMGKPSEMGRNTMMMLARKAGPECDKARELLGYEPKVSLKEGMQHVEKWLKETGLI